MADDPTSLIDEWVARPQNTARTVLVTIFGDTIQPATSSVWLAQLFKLTDALGFNERLVRTSMTRLVAEGWLDNERVGRQSRYSLTETALAETLEAEQRIYHRADPTWPGRWGVVFVDGANLEPTHREQVVTQLRWHGFVPLSRGVLGSPAHEADQALVLARSISPDVLLPTGAMEFAEVDELVNAGFFGLALQLDEVAHDYRRLLAFHHRVERCAADAEGADAFALRTMLVHDLRRVRLRTIDVPAALLPSKWPGTEAHDLAQRLYHRFADASATWVGSTLEHPQPPELVDRFATTRTAASA
ncbi:MAG: PaaX family transcriptional regulator C-terminal domain-containing protein [Ilumatobacter sp.]